MSKTRYIVQSVLTVIFLGGVALGVNYLFQAVATGPQSTLSGDDAPYPPPGFTLPAPDPGCHQDSRISRANPHSSSGCGRRTQYILVSDGRPGPGILH